MVAVVVADKLLGLAGKGIGYDVQSLQHWSFGLNHCRGYRMESYGFIVGGTEGKGIIATQYKAEVIQFESGVFSHGLKYVVLDRNILIHYRVGLEKTHHFFRRWNLKITSDLIGEHGGAEGLISIYRGNRLCP